MKADHRLRVVIDTNVWISAMLSAGGAPALLVRQVLAYGIAVFTQATFEELESRVWKPKFDPYLSIEARRLLLHDVNAVAQWVEVPPDIAAGAWSRDADDDAFVRTALAAKAPWLITGDKDLLSIPPLHGLSILTPAAALTLPEFQS